jgi:hypothetical protein
MKTYAILLSVVLAASVATSAEAAKHARHHARAHAGAKASSTDWPGNPGMDLTQNQVNAFWRDAFNPAAAKPGTKY